MEYKRLIIRGVSYSRTQTGAYALILEERESALKLPIVIGSFEAQSISLALEKGIKISRPNSHDLFANFVEGTAFEPLSVTIYQLTEGVFFSHLNFTNTETGKDFILDARTSDAVAMAVRFGIPIYAKKEVIEEAGVLLDMENTDENQEDTEPNLDSLFDDLAHLSLQELQSLLDTAVQNEDYEMAFEIQEVIKQRKGEKF